MVVGELVDHVARALPGASVHLVGSRRMGGALPGADVDLVTVVPVGVPPSEAVERRAGSWATRQRRR